MVTYIKGNIIDSMATKPCIFCDKEAQYIESELACDLTGLLDAETIDDAIFKIEDCTNNMDNDESWWVFVQLKQHRGLADVVAMHVECALARVDTF
jgi:hypothetical protein